MLNRRLITTRKLIFTQINPRIKPKPTPEPKPPSELNLLEEVLVELRTIRQLLTQINTKL